MRHVGSTMQGTTAHWFVSAQKGMMTACMVAGLHGCATSVCKSSLHAASDAADLAPVFPRSRDAAEAISNAERYNGQYVRVRGYMSIESGLILDGDSVPIPLRSVTLYWSPTEKCFYSLLGHRVEIVGRLTVPDVNWTAKKQPLSLDEVTEVSILD